MAETKKRKKGILEGILGSINPFKKIEKVAKDALRPPKRRGLVITKSLKKRTPQQQREQLKKDRLELEKKLKAQRGGGRTKKKR